MINKNVPQKMGNPSDAFIWWVLLLLHSAAFVSYGAKYAQETGSGIAASDIFNLKTVLLIWNKC